MAAGKGETVTEKVKTTAGLVEKLASDLLRITTDKEVVVEMEDALDFTRAIEKVAGGKKCLVLSIPGENMSAGPEVRKYASGEVASRFIRARAIVVEAFHLRLMANFFIRFNKPVAPTKLFGNEEEAMSWLLSFRERDRSG